ncbi:hypothetical protein IVB36_28300 [Bradyrhizobium sp. 35]|nr:hypothetical protein [Bradyrhizobium sp. 35]
MTKNYGTTKTCDLGVARIHIEKINYPFLYTLKASGAEFGAGIRCAVQKGWLDLHESGTYVRLLTAVGT